MTPKAEVRSPEQFKFTEAMFKALSKELTPLITNRGQTAVRPTTYRDFQNGTFKEWLLVTELYLERVYSPEQKSITLKLLMKLEFHNQQAGVRPVFSRAAEYFAHK